LTARRPFRRILPLFSCLACSLLTSCGGGHAPASGTPIPTTYTLTVNSSGATGVAIGVTPEDLNKSGNGSTTFTRTYDSATTVTLTAPAVSGNYEFSAWSGCTSATTVICTVTLDNNPVITAAFVLPAITSVAVEPNPANLTIGSSQQFTVVVEGNGTFDSTVTWSLLGPVGSALSAGTLTSSGLYTTPYPAPQTVTVVATSTQDPSISGSETVSLAPPPPAIAPALTVDVGNPTHAISPLIYGMDAYTLDPSVTSAANLGIVRWGGDSTSRYNYKLDVTSSAGDYYFENQTGSDGDDAPAVPGTSAFDALVQTDFAAGAKTLGTVPVMGWVAKDATSCSFSLALYPNQYAVDSSRQCGDGELPDQSNIAGNDPAVTSLAVGPKWAGDWVAYLVSKFGAAASGGVAIYELDNEPTWWDTLHRDVHPLPSTYDEVTQNGIATALAIKTADSTAEVSGPVVDFWWNYFYSKKDIESGWSTGPCNSPWSNPIDRDAHGGVPFLEYYLRQFAAYDATNRTRLLDYLDLHTYFAAEYQGKSVAFTTAGDTGEQQARLNSTRIFWDPTYTDPNYPQPNYKTDANYTTSCSPPAQAPQLIPQMQAWITKDYPGTKTAITEYNWGGQEHINGALAQADILGLFGSYGLDIGTLWGPPKPQTQMPGRMAFEIFRNYDGNNSAFGDVALASTSANQGLLSIYGALRSADQAVTVIVINKGYGDLNGNLSLADLTPNGAAKVYRYSNANLAAIVAQPDAAVSGPGAASTTSFITATFPAQSITLYVVPPM
jgi:hypothetical protein